MPPDHDASSCTLCPDVTEYDDADSDDESGWVIPFVGGGCEALTYIGPDWADCPDESVTMMQ